MSDQANTECGICGRVPGPVPGCNTCGGNVAFTRERSYTLSEIRSGQAPMDNRYGRDPGNPEVGPRTSDPLWAGAGGQGGGF